MIEPLTPEEEAALRRAHRPCDCNRARGLDASGQRVSDPDPHCIRRTGCIGPHGRAIEPWCEADRLLATLDAARAARPSLDLATLLKDDVRALAHLTPEQWDERRGLDPIARTINAVFDIIDARLATPASPGDERLRELAAEAAQYGSTLATLLTILPAECQQDGDACAAHNAEWSTRNGADLGHCEWIEARAEIVPEWRSAEHALRAALAAEEAGR